MQEKSIHSNQDTPQNEDDFPINYFNIAPDLEITIPLLQEMIRLNPEGKIFASPWSAPPWMKTNKSMKGGRLREDCYEAFAQYFVKYIQSYQEKGLDIYAITTQTVPGFGESTCRGVVTIK